MTISEHSPIDDLLAVCLHFTEEVDERFADILEHYSRSLSVEIELNVSVV